MQKLHKIGESYTKIGVYDAKSNVNCVKNLVI